MQDFFTGPQLAELLGYVMMYAGARIEEFSARVDTAHGVVGCAYKP